MRKEHINFKTHDEISFQVADLAVLYDAIVVIVPHIRHVADLRLNLEFLITDGRKVVLFPELNWRVGSMSQPSFLTQYQRCATFYELQTSDKIAVITTASALIYQSLDPQFFAKKIITFEVGAEYNMEIIINDLCSLGYIRVDAAQALGEFAVRGGIVDIGMNEGQGYRVEFFGDTVEDIRTINLATQLSSPICQKFISLHGLSEFCKPDEAYSTFFNHLSQSNSTIVLFPGMEEAIFQEIEEQNKAATNDQYLKSLSETELPKVIENFSIIKLAMEKSTIYQLSVLN